MAIPTPIEIYRVSETIDDMGRTGKIVGYFTDKDSALLVSDGHGWYGGQGKVETLHAIEAGSGKYFLLAQPKPVRLDVDLVKELAAKKEKALAKLTSEERRLLGL